MLPLLRYLRQHRPYALLSTLMHVNLWAVWAIKMAGLPTKVFLRESTDLSRLLSLYNPWKNRLYSFLIKKTYPHATAVIAVSRQAATSLQQFIGLRPEKLAAIYNPVITADLKEKAAAAPEHPWLQENHPPVILAAGRLSPEKDFPTLIRAFHLVRRRHPAKLIILGEGPDRQRLIRLVNKLHLSADVSLPGYIPNPYAYMARAAVFVLSSLLEGLPGVLIEAMACGCRLVSTDCPSGPREILQNGKYGQLVPMQDPEAMASAILQALAQPSLVPDQDWLQQFTVEAAVKKYYKVIFQ